MIDQITLDQRQAVVFYTLVKKMKKRSKCNDTARVVNWLFENPVYLKFELDFEGNLD